MNPFDLSDEELKALDDRRLMQLSVMAGTLLVRIRDEQAFRDIRHEASRVMKLTNDEDPVSGPAFVIVTRSPEAVDVFAAPPRRANIDWRPKNE